ncbi:Rne/Rng family ribonuclease [Bacillus marinisedimentorum]|uniref:Rne/Rng family ribonuclease n=1 Tax=Bacillus marinisedimentorum TaxID=1821260 RepID=UPI000873486D|nr:Rne/Rng family ribonuclease [Bacillus marinisedimentorum]
MRHLILNMAGTEKRMAVLEGSRLAEVVIRHPGKTSILGNIYKGRVIDVLPGMQACFVDIGIGKNGYLHRDQLLSFKHNKKAEGEKDSLSISQLVKQGEELIVQVVKEPTGDKGPKLTNIVEVPGRGLVYLPDGNYVAVSKRAADSEREKMKSTARLLTENREGLIVRTAGLSWELGEMKEELRYLRRRWREMTSTYSGRSAPILIYEENDFIEQIMTDAGLENIRLITADDSLVCNKLKERLSGYSAAAAEVEFYRGERGIFSAFGLEQQIEKALQQKVWLKSGGYLVVETTEAMTVIDVNTGKFTGRRVLSETVYKTNMEAATEIAKQVRLRNLSGILLIDFIDMKKDTDRKAVLKELQQAFSSDKQRTDIKGFTRLGLVEMTRKKTRQSLLEQMTDPCPSCSGTGRVRSSWEVLYMLERELLDYSRDDAEAAWVEASADVAGLLRTDKERFDNIANKKLFITISDAVRPFAVIRRLGMIAEIKESIAKR